MPRQANEFMTPAEQVAFAWEHRAFFAEVAAHNMEITRCRYSGDWDNEYRNAWAQLAGSHS